MAIGSALAVTGCSQSSRNPDKPVEATYIPREASASGDDGAALDAHLDADDDVPDAPAVEPPPPMPAVQPPPPNWADAALVDAALGTHVDGGFVCVNSYPDMSLDPPPAVCDPKTQYCYEYDYSSRASEGCYALDAGPFPTPIGGWSSRCSYDPVPVAGSCTCRELDDAGALAISCGSCYGSPPPRRRGNGAKPLRLAAAARCIRSGSTVSMRRS